MSTRVRRNLAGRAPKGVWIEGKIAVSVNLNPKDNHKMTVNTPGAAGFTIKVQPSGRTYTALPEESVLAAGIREGIGLPYGCKDGACGSCKCKLLSGQIQLGEHQEKALSADEASAGLILTCRATPLSDLVLESKQVTSVDALPVKKMPTRVATLVRKTADVMVLHLQLPANDALLYHAGQYIEFLLRDGVRRSYSMANAPHNGPMLELHIRHMPGGKFTDHVFGDMKEKEILRIEGPFGSFYLREDSNKPIILLASGTGFAPIKALIEQLQQKQTTRQVTLYWGGRKPSDLYMNDWMHTQLESMPTLHFVPVISDAQPEDAWTGRTGFVHRAVLEDHPDLSAFQVYACGAPVVIDAARHDYTTLAGLPMEEFFADSFTSEADKTPA
jgi:CDP-4-dehydro-6-deoxyglucose reductase